MYELQTDTVYTIKRERGIICTSSGQGKTLNEYVSNHSVRPEHHHSSLAFSRSIAASCQGLACGTCTWYLGRHRTYRRTWNPIQDAPGATERIFNLARMASISVRMYSICFSTDSLCFVFSEADWTIKSDLPICFK